MSLLMFFHLEYCVWDRFVLGMCTFVLFSNSCSFCYSLVHIVRAIRFFFFHVNDLRIILLYFQFLVFFFSLFLIILIHILLWPAFRMVLLALFLVSMLRVPFQYVLYPTKFHPLGPISRRKKNKQRSLLVRISTSRNMSEKLNCLSPLKSERDLT